MYKYFAFISFQNADAREAVRLQHAIERYRLPAVLCRDHSVPRRIKPLYCYLNDMHAGEELMQELKQRMEQSRYLLVVCSPHSARSVYVNSGIDYFVSLGRRDSIIPVIVDGVPYSNDPATECFPEALRRHFPKHADPLQDHSILGINLREAGIGSRRSAYSRAMLMVVARMLQLDYDGLLLRDRQRRRRRAIAASLLTAGVMTALGMTWHMAQPVPVALTVHETTPVNTNLPPLQPVACTLHLDNEVKTDTFLTTADTLVLPNVPHRFIGQPVRIELTGARCVPLDTTVVLQSSVSLPLRRDADVYGHIAFRLRGIAHPERTTVRIAGHEVVPHANGVIALDLPIEEQRTAYAVEARGQRDTLHMPCGKDDIILLTE